jgi:hypothetical protein
MGRKKKSGTIFKFRPSEEVKTILSNVLKGEKTKFVEEAIKKFIENN